MNTAFPWGHRQNPPPESDQTISGSKPTAVPLDTTLFAIVSDMGRSVFSDQEQIISGDMAEAKPGEEFGGGDVESHPRGA